MTEKRARDATSPYTLKESSRQLRRVAESIEKKMKRLPQGRMAVIVACETQDSRASVVKPAWKVVGADERLVEAVRRVLPAVEAVELELAHREHAGAVPTIMPGNAERRAKETRKLLALAWQEHARGTVFEGTKQMYNVVSKHPEMQFEWWDDVTCGAKFVNTAVDDPVVSERVFRFLAGAVTCF